VNRRATPSRASTRRDRRSRKYRLRQRGISIGDHDQAPDRQLASGATAHRRVCNAAAALSISPPAITTEHALRAGSLPGPHRDPFDRILIAQSSFESLPIISADAVFASYGLDVVWNSSA
jgi:hypothetical protein